MMRRCSKFRTRHYPALNTQSYPLQTMNDEKNMGFDSFSASDR